MIPAPFDYEVAESADHAVALLGQHGEDAKLLAGGHSLLPLMRLRLATPSVLVDIGRLRDLSYVRDGAASRTRISGSSECPPASSLASSPFSWSIRTASSRLSGAS